MFFSGKFILYNSSTCRKGAIKFSLVAYSALMLAKLCFNNVKLLIGAVGIGVPYVAVVRATTGSTALRPPKNRAAKPCISRSPSASAASLITSGAGRLWLL